MGVDSGEKILVCDFHYGCGMAHVSSLNEAGAGVQWIDLSGSYQDYRISAGSKFYGGYHKKLSDTEKEVKLYIRRAFSGEMDLSYRVRKKVTYTLLKRGILSYHLFPTWFGMSWTPKKSRALHGHFGERVMRAIFADYDTYWTTFPPSMAQFFLYLAEKYDKRLVLNMAHRFNSGLASRRENKAMVSLLRYLHEHPRHVLAGCTEYECRYTEYYLGFRPKLLPLTCFHFKLQLPTPDLETVLISSAGSWSLQAEKRLNVVAQRWCQKNKCKTIKLARIKSLYEEYTYEDLARHPAVVIFPYSAYSVSMIELYELNIPFFVPSPDMLLQYGILRDRVLHPIYCSRLCYSLSLSLPNQSDMPFSPNSYAADAQRYWLQFCYFYQVKNAIIWHSEEDLIEKLHTVDLEQVRRKMYEENKDTRTAALREYKAVVYEHKEHKTTEA